MSQLRLPEWEEIAPALRRAVRRRFGTQRAFARRLGVSEGLLSRWLSGALPPGFDQAMRIEALLGEPLVTLPARAGSGPPEALARLDERLAAVDGLDRRISDLESAVVPGLRRIAEAVLSLKPHGPPRLVLVESADDEARERGGGRGGGDVSPELDAGGLPGAADGAARPGPRAGGSRMARAPRPSPPPGENVPLADFDALAAGRAQSVEAVAARGGKAPAPSGASALALLLLRGGRGVG